LIDGKGWTTPTDTRENESEEAQDDLEAVSEAI
jgi:hypothetical protein